jgi:hypothetical protein
MKKQLYIPEISDQMTLAEDWTFALHPEYRNKDLGSFFGYDISRGWPATWIPKVIETPIVPPTDLDGYISKARADKMNNLTVTIPKGTILQVDRIYIRKGSSDYSSITFYAKNLGEVETTRHTYSGIGILPAKKKVKKKALRFWAKLSDCNTIVFE